MSRCANALRMLTAIRAYRSGKATVAFSSPASPDAPGTTCSASFVATIQHLKPQVHFLCDAKGELAVDYVVKMEDGDAVRALQRRLAECRQMPWLADAVLPVVNQSKTNDWRSAYDDDTLAHVLQLYAADFALLGYPAT